ncbi:sodium transport system permease protein [Caloramator quimbayensis]|uniref:Sodium transport system permease protein n=1 Tax=Caloramator quimbayensis TaxID=1147123 RepID=A0A1T4Y2S7_9CLOT|nr:ABC transporter permease [Caloramator quimbayensis]SKA96050.1 sodium transport system permease protein [Caloramator quimbayensis]
MNMKAIMIVFKKELTDLLRDKKTVIVGILIPLIIFPIMFGLIGRSVEGNIKKTSENLKIAIQSQDKSQLAVFLKSQKNITVVDSNDIKKDVQEGKIYVGLIIPQNIEESIKDEKSAEIKIIYDDTSQNSNMACNIIKSLIEEYSKEIVKSRLMSKGIDYSILTPINIKEEIAAKDEGGFGKFMLSLLLPLMLIIYGMTGPMAAATDLGAGEKERGTLEPLLTTQAGRMSLLFGKLLSITVMGFMGTVSSIIGLMIGVKAGGSVFGGDMPLLLSPITVIMIGIFVLLIIMVFGALELSISIYARSFKEAQTYLSPLTIIGMAGAYGTYMIDVKNVSTILFNVPLANVSLIIKEFIIGIYNPLHIGMTFGWNLVYIFLAVLFARYMFSKEEVIFRA